MNRFSYLNRFGQAVSKFIFCLRVSRNSKTLFRLIRNTRRFSSFFRSQNNGLLTAPDELCEYQFNLAGIKQTTFLRTYTGDIQMFYEQFWQEVYLVEPRQTEHPPTIIDAGANIGMATLYFLAKNPKATIYAIEPDPSNISILRRNLSAYISKGGISNVGLSKAALPRAGESHAAVIAPQVVIIPFALSSEEGSATLETGGWSYNSRISEPGSPAKANDHDQQPGIRTEIIPTTTMKIIIDENNITHVDLLKLDIEGSEGLLFTGDISWLHIVENILVEIHDEQMKPTIKAILTANGFRMKKFNRNEFGDVYFATRTKEDVSA